MTKQEAAIIGAYTGYLIGEFSDLHEYIERIMERPVWTHEMASKALFKEIQDKAKADFMLLAEEIT